MARLPLAQVLLGVVEDLARGLALGVRLALVARHDGGVVEQVDQLARLAGEQDLLLGALDDGGRVQVVCLLQLLAGDVGELGLGHEGLGFGADELLLELRDLGGRWLLVLELLNLVGDLGMG